jgi:hypothetical protein
VRKHAESRVSMRATLVSFGVIEIDGRRYEHDVVISAGHIRRRDKAPSKVYQGEFGHTPLSAAETIPWSGSRLIVGTGASGQLPITESVLREAERRGIQIDARPTSDACDLLRDIPCDKVFAILHVTC